MARTSCWARKMVQLISGLDRLTERKIAGQDDVFSV
jgi:hypothetical protein